MIPLKQELAIVMSFTAVKVLFLPKSPPKVDLQMKPVRMQYMPIPWHEVQLLRVEQLSENASSLSFSCKWSFFLKASFRWPSRRSFQWSILQKFKSNLTFKCNAIMTQNYFLKEFFQVATTANVLVSDSCHESQQFAIPFSVDIPKQA